MSGEHTPLERELLEAAERLLTTFDKYRSTTVAERIVTGVSDASLRADAEAAMTDLRAAIQKARG